MAVLPTDYQDVSTPTGALTEFPATTTRGMNAVNEQINTNTTKIAAAMGVIGSAATPLTDAGTARPTGYGAIYWICANGVTPSNAATGDIVFNASA